MQPTLRLDDHQFACVLEQFNRQSYLMAGMVELMGVIAKANVQNSHYNIGDKSQIMGSINDIISKAGT